MPKKKGFSRADRIADQMQRELAELIRSELKDPRVGFITLTGVEVTRDYSHAKVFYTVMNAEDPSETQDTLARAAGWLRSEIARTIKIFTVPQLHFVYDHSIEHGLYMDALLNRVAQEDAELRPEDEDAGEGEAKS